MTRPLPPDFQFSQSSLKDYLDCARRFELRYKQALKWPAVESEPLLERERLMQQGTDFHHRVHQHLAGIPAAALTPPEQDPQLARWWGHYLNSAFVDSLPAQRHPEAQLAAPIAGGRLVAKYDLIALQPGESALIVDWKTAGRKPARARLEASLQTRVYAYLLVRAGGDFNGGQPISPEQVEMVYWFAEFPDSPERFVYSRAQYEADAAFLEALITEIRQRQVFDLTTDTRRCQFCTYRSLCARGISAGDITLMDSSMLDDADMPPDPDFGFDFDHIAEVEF